LFKISAFEASGNTQFSNQLNIDVYNRSKAYGISVANAVWEYSATDKEGHDKYLDPRPASYTPPVGPGKWYGPAKPMYPYWGKVRTLAISESDRLARAPLPYSEDKTSAYYAQGLEVYAATMDWRILERRCFRIYVQSCGARLGNRDASLGAKKI
jgi:hypothetical protein